MKIVFREFTLPPIDGRGLFVPSTNRGEETFGSLRDLLAKAFSFFFRRIKKFKLFGHVYGSRM